MDIKFGIVVDRAECLKEVKKYAHDVYANGEITKSQYEYFSAYLATRYYFTAVTYWYDDADLLPQFLEDGAIVSAIDAVIYHCVTKTGVKVPEGMPIILRDDDR